MNRALQDIKICTSLSNLKTAKPKGQVATLLILIITAILIFTLIVANIGQVSNYATNLSNAADASSMYFASQIGTKSTQLSESLMKSCGNPEKCCRKTGMLSIVVAIVLEIIAIIVTIITVGGASPFLIWTSAHMFSVIIAAAVIGAIGGAIGGAIAGTGVLQGAIQGAMIGAAIGGGIVGGGAIGADIGIMIGTSAELGATLLAPVMIGAVIGASLGAALAITSSIYTAYVKDAMLGDAMASAVKGLNGLPETDRIRESIYLQALSSTIDDPNKLVDVYDSDGDGNTTELVPRFQYCWDRRIVELKQGVLESFSDQKTEVTQFLRGAGSPVQKFIVAINQFLPYLNRMEVEGSDGPIVELLRAVEAAKDFNYDFNFWEPGPSAAELAAWKDWDPNACPNCEPPDAPAGYDEVDYAIDDVGSDFMDEIGALREQTDDNLVYNWRQWVPWFYDPEGTYDNYYDSLGSLINGDISSEPMRIGLEGWINEIERIRQGLPECKHPWKTGFSLTGAVRDYTRATNPPCKCTCHEISSVDISTIDESLTDIDEFVDVITKIDNFIQSVEEFRQACAQFYETMKSLAELEEFGTSTCGLSGSNPVTYSWDDSRGNHSVQVGLSSYNMPIIVKKKYGNWLKGKICMELRYWQQNLNVTIDRQDPANVNVGVLGAWNSSSGGTIRRSSKSQYQGLATDAWVKMIGK